jgi:Uma2 family endonuclease
VTFDQGEMEIFKPSFGHEDDSHLLGRMIETLTDELDVPVKAGRTTTHKRKDLNRATEPDQCYWLRQNAQLMVGKRQLDLTVDPPPDLVVEVDVTSSSLARLPIFAAMGIPEVWRLASGVLEFLHLEADGRYEARDMSQSFPTFSVADIARFLEQGRGTEETAWIRSFRAYVRDRLTH